MSKRFFLIFILFVLLPGCAQFYGSQPPAPVYGGGGRTTSKTQQAPAPYPGNEEKQRVSKSDSSDTVMTEPLEEQKKSPESIEFKPEPMQPDSETVEPDEQAGEQQPLTQSLETTQKAQEPNPEPRTLTPFEPLETSAPMSPAVDALVLAANQNTTSGNLEVASATIERAIRIEPRNANLYYKLALVRLNQSKPRLAEDLAKKSALLAAGDSTLKKHSWLLIAHARELQNNFKGAKEARAKANRL
jgi:tetratricopeptide (TPR) repeat protein